jgi:hypothetical protein
MTTIRPVLRPRDGAEAPVDLSVLRPWAVAVAVWFAAVLVLSASGALRVVPLVVLPTLIAAGIVVPLVAAARSPRTRRLVREIDLAHLTWFNAWRIPAALVFFAVGARGLLPERFVTNAAWGDLVAGILAIVVVAAGTRLQGRRRWAAYLGFHVFSFGDFVVAVGTGLTFTLLGDELMRTLLDTPVALIPLWGVPITGAISLLALHRLVTRRA